MLKQYRGMELKSDGETGRSQAGGSEGRDGSDKERKKQLKSEQKQQRKEARRRAKEIAKREDELADDDEGGGFGTLLATIMIVMVWLAVILVIIKLDVGGFGSKVLTPILQDVPVLNRVLPGNSILETKDPESYGGYTSLVDAVDQIRQLELELERLQTSVSEKDEEIVELKANVVRLQEFEQRQLDFQRIRNDFWRKWSMRKTGPVRKVFRSTMRRRILLRRSLFTAR